MFDVIATADWQSHHLMLFSVGGVRFNLHFVIWAAALCFFMVWCEDKKERAIAICLFVFQFVILLGAYGLDYLDYVNSTVAQYTDYILNVSSEQERSFGVRPDALLFAFIDYLTVLVLTKILVRPRRIIDPLTLVLVSIIFLHLVVATFSFESTGALMAYDIIWTVLYYAVFALLFLSSGRMEKAIGHISVLDYSHILFGSDRAKTLS